MKLYFRNEMLFCSYHPQFCSTVILGSCTVRTNWRTQESATDSSSKLHKRNNWKEKKRCAKRFHLKKAAAKDVSKINKKRDLTFLEFLERIWQLFSKEPLRLNAICVFYP